MVGKQRRLLYILLVVVLLFIIYLLISLSSRPTENARRHQMEHSQFLHVLEEVKKNREKFVPQHFDTSVRHATVICCIFVDLYSTESVWAQAKVAMPIYCFRLITARATVIWHKWYLWGTDISWYTTCSIMLMLSNFLRYSNIYIFNFHVHIEHLSEIEKCVLFIDKIQLYCSSYCCLCYFFVT